MADLHQAAPPEPPPERFRLLWLLTPDVRLAYPDGAVLRFTRISRALVAAGHAVFYLVPQDPSGRMKSFLEGLQAGRVITGWFEIPAHRYDRLPWRFSRLLAHPSVARRLNRHAESIPRQAVLNLLRTQAIDVCIIGGRYFLFLLPEVSRHTKVVIDWVDSNVRYGLRHIAASLRLGRTRGLVRSVRQLYGDVLDEAAYGRMAHLNLAASAGDKAALDRLNRRPSRNRVLLNGIDGPFSGPSPDRLPGRLIFTGAMDYPPNYQAAIWFVDRVLPLVLRERPHVQMVLAGRDPIPELRARASPKVVVTGAVDDLHSEMARSELYVAPLISGTGFKNKVVEALAAGTFVVGTPCALEFLRDDLRQCLLEAESPRRLAASILSYLDNPAAYAPRLERARRILAQEFGWEQQAEVLVQLMRSLWLEPAIRS